MSTMEALVLSSTGELLLRGPNVMPGYMRDEANVGVFEEGGWMRTGDVVRVDKDGYLFIVDRVKECARGPQLRQHILELTETLQ